jgi:hypothetical protein
LISGASFNGTTYTVGSSGTYLATATIVASANAAVSPTILVNGNPVAHGTAASAFAYAAGSQGRGIVSVMLSLTAGDTIKISGTNANSTVSAVLSTNGTTRFSIAKL